MGECLNILEGGSESGRDGTKIDIGCNRGAGFW